jgi:quinol monooxygenase YgiN
MILASLRIIVKRRGQYPSSVLVVSRFRVSTADADAFRREMEIAHAALAARPGYQRGTLGRNVDDPELWLLSTQWEHVGAYRRALSSYDVKMHAVPLLSRAVDEPSAYEVVEPGTDLNVASPRALG